MKLHKLGVVAETVSYRRTRLVRQIFQATDGTVYPICPRCGCTMEREYMCFCDRCGQKLGWSLFPYATVRRMPGKGI